MIHSDRSTASGMELDFGHGLVVTVPYSNFAGISPGDPGNQRVLDGIRDFIYSQLDGRRKKNTLPRDELARSTDPAQEGFFWDGQGGNPDVVTRPYIVTVTWDGERYQYGFRVPRK